MVETAKAIPIPNDQQILHIVPQAFTIDGQDDVREPLGMSGVRLEVDVHIVTGAVSAVENVTKCIRRCGLDVRDVILQPLASATAVLSDDEKDLGVCLIDIGGGTSDIAVYAGGAIRHTAVIPDRRRPGDQRHRDDAAHADQGSGGAQGRATAARCASSPTRTTSSRCRASASARRASCRGRCSPR